MVDFSGLNLVGNIWDDVRTQLIKIKHNNGRVGFLTLTQKCHIFSEKCESVVQNFSSPTLSSVTEQVTTDLCSYL